MMREQGDPNGYVTPKTELLGYTLINDRIVPETFIQRVIHQIKDTTFVYGEVLRDVDIFDVNYLESLPDAEREILMAVVLQLIARGEIGLDVWKRPTDRSPEFPFAEPIA